MSITKPRLAALIFGAFLTVLVAACGGGASGQGNDGVTITPLGDLTPTATPEPSIASATNGATANSLRGFAYPIVGGCLPKTDSLMPNAPREYRKGVHEGVDFYGVDNCTSVVRGTPIVAAKAGRVIRTDLNYVDITPAEVAQAEAEPNRPESLDKFRGRQVWIDHGNGIVTRYCHLAAIAPGLTVGAQVAQGQQIANVGNSGTPESISNPAAEMHLHFELRVGDTYLGAGQSPGQVRGLYVALFAP